MYWLSAAEWPTHHTDGTAPSCHISSTISINVNPSIGFVAYDSYRKVFWQPSWVQRFHATMFTLLCKSRRGPRMYKDCSINQSDQQQTAILGHGHLVPSTLQLPPMNASCNSSKDCLTILLKARRFLALKQETKCVDDFALSFRTLATGSGWNEPELKASYRQRAQRWVPHWTSMPWWPTIPWGTYQHVHSTTVDTLLRNRRIAKINVHPAPEVQTTEPMQLGQIVEQYGRPEVTSREIIFLTWQSPAPSGTVIGLAPTSPTDHLWVSIFHVSLQQHESIMITFPHNFCTASSYDTLREGLLCYSINQLMNNWKLHWLHPCRKAPAVLSTPATLLKGTSSGWRTHQKTISHPLYRAHCPLCQHQESVSLLVTITTKLPVVLGFP